MFYSITLSFMSKSKIVIKDLTSIINDLLNFLTHLNQNDYFLGTPPITLSPTVNTFLKRQ